MQIAEKIRLLRKANNLTQAAFAESIGISRGNLANIELGKVQPTPVFINCVSLMYNVERAWLTDDEKDDLSVLNGSAGMLARLIEKYEMLDDAYKKFVENQISQLLEMQDENKGKQKNDGSR